MIFGRFQRDACLGKFRKAEHACRAGEFVGFLQSRFGTRELGCTVNRWQTLQRQIQQSRALSLPINFETAKWPSYRCACIRLMGQHRLGLAQIVSVFDDAIRSLRRVGQ
jgi:hypothetical protein